MNVPLKALFDFKGDAKEHKINIKQGEQIELIEPSNEHWWRGRNSSNEAGFFPKSYVKIDGTEYHVMHTFTPEKENLETQIVVNEGETVHVVEKSNDLWWRGVSKRYKSGFFPAAFVCPMSEAKELQKRNSLKASKIETKEASETVKKESEVKIINSSNSQTVNKANKQRHSSILHQTGTAMLNKSPNTTFKPPIILQTGGGLKKPTLSNRPKSKQTSFNSNTRQSHLSVQLAKLSIETVDQELQRSSSTGNINESDEEDEFEIIQRTQRDGSVIVENPLSNPVPKKFPERRNSKRMSRNSLPTRRMSLPNGNRAFSALLQNKMMERISELTEENSCDTVALANQNWTDFVVDAYDAEEEEVPPATAVDNKFLTLLLGTQESMSQCAYEGCDTLVCQMFDREAFCVKHMSYLANPDYQD